MAKISHLAISTGRCEFKKSEPIFYRREKILEYCEGAGKLIEECKLKEWKKIREEWPRLDCQQSGVEEVVSFRDRQLH
jgi:hypothetical protein